MIIVGGALDCTTSEHPFAALGSFVNIRKKKIIKQNVLGVIRKKFMVSMN
jgi:hypothetical protein